MEKDKNAPEFVIERNKKLLGAYSSIIVTISLCETPPEDFIDSLVRLIRQVTVPCIYDTHGLIHQKLTKPDNLVSVLFLQLEKEQLPLTQIAELGISMRTPKIDLIHLRLIQQKSIPLEVRICDKEVHKTNLVSFG